MWHISFCTFPGCLNITVVQQFLVIQLCAYVCLCCVFLSDMVSQSSVCVCVCCKLYVVKFLFSIVLNVCWDSISSFSLRKHCILPLSKNRKRGKEGECNTYTTLQKCIWITVARHAQFARLWCRQSTRHKFWAAQGCYLDTWSYTNTEIIN